MKKAVATALSLCCGYFIATGSAFADLISPNVNGNNQVYSGETPNSAYFGTGPGANYSEASELRMQAEQDTRNGRIDPAIRKLRKAVQLEPGDPQGHMLYARALTAKIKASPADASILPLVYKALDEWKMLWHHDVDWDDQREARGQAQKLGRLAKLIVKKEHENHGISQDEAIAAAAQRNME